MSLLWFALSLPAAAVEPGNALSIHGFGNWAYGKTDGNSYVNGNDEGTWDQMEFSLSVAATPAPNFAVHAQAFWEMSEGETESSVDFAFAEYDLSQAVGLRAGRIKQPFGLYTEIFDVGVLSPFNHLPQGIYGPSGFVTEGFMGLGATGAVDLTPGLRLQYDLYGGELEAALTTPWAEAEASADSADPSTDVQDMIGGRLQVGAPDGSYTVGASAYTGSVDTKSQGEEAEGDRHSAVGAHAELMLDAFTLRAEYAYESAETFSANAAYAEGSYLITPHWRVALRYDWTKVDLDDAEGVDDDLLKSADLGVALNYIVNPNFLVKVAYHAVDGNRFTTANEDEELKDKTTLVSAGISFSF